MLGFARRVSQLTARIIVPAMMQVQGGPALLDLTRRRVSRRSVGSASGSRARPGSATADARVERVDRLELVRFQHEVKDVEVLDGALRSNRLRDGGPALVDVPAQDDPRGALRVFRGGRGDDALAVLAAVAAPSIS